MYIKHCVDDIRKSCDAYESIISLYVCNNYILYNMMQRFFESKDMFHRFVTLKLHVPMSLFREFLRASGTLAVSYCL